MARASDVTIDDASRSTLAAVSGWIDAVGMLDVGDAMARYLAYPELEVTFNHTKRTISTKPPASVLRGLAKQANARSIRFATQAPIAEFDVFGRSATRLFVEVADLLKYQADALDAITPTRWEDGSAAGIAVAAQAHISASIASVTAHTQQLLEQFSLLRRSVAGRLSDLDGDHAGSGWRRRRISDSVRLAVWQRDGGRCVRCQDVRDLEYDHDIPHSKGGSDSAENIQLLCLPCNRSKGAKLF